MKAENGDVVKVKTEEGEYQGTLLPRPEIFEAGHIILKLSSGYNIGIAEKKIKKIEVLEKYKEPKVTKRKLKNNPKLPTVSLLSFGGTISSKVDYKTGGTYADYTAEDFVDMMPELDSIANMRAKKIMGIMSEDMNPEHWKVMAEEIEKELNDPKVSGVVVSQGTDTMHFSSAIMSFMLPNLSKPVIFTASQRSIDRGSSDAFMNIICAVQAATSDIASVMTCMHGTLNDDYCLLIRGTRVRKMHTVRRDAFRPIDELPFAKQFPDGKLEIINNNFNKRTDEKVTVEPLFEKKTGLIYAYPGMDPDLLNVFIEKKYKGLVIAATALGHVPTIEKNYTLLPKIKELEKNGCTVIIASQTIYGQVHPFVYTNLRKLSVEHSCLFVEDMMPEVAYTKLGWVLGKEKKAEKIRELMMQNLAGEITERSDTRSFLA